MTTKKWQDIRGLHPAMTPEKVAHIEREVKAELRRAKAVDHALRKAALASRVRD